MAGNDTEDTTRKDSSPEEPSNVPRDDGDSSSYDANSLYDDDDDDDRDYRSLDEDRSQYQMLKRQIEDLEDVVDELKRNQEKKRKSANVVEGIYKEKVQWELPYDETTADIIGPSVVLKKRSYEVRPWTTGRSTDSLNLKINVNLKENDVNRTDKYFRFPPTITVSLKNPEDNPGMRKDCIRVWDLGFDSPIIGSTYQHVFPLEIVEANVNKEGKIDVSVYVSQAGASSTDGIVQWPMVGYAMNAALIKDGYLRYVEGPTLYTTSEGYRVKIKMVLGKVVRAIVQFVAGEFDKDLPKSFYHLTTISIFNKWDCLSHITQSAVNDLAKTNSYQIELATHEKLEKEGFLVDDTLHFLINISEIYF